VESLATSMPFGHIIIIIVDYSTESADLSTGVDELVFDDQGCRGDDLPEAGVFHHGDVIVARLLHVLEMFCVETKKICTSLL